MTDTLGGTIVETLATLGVRATNEEGTTDARLDGWIPTVVETIGGVDAPSDSAVAPTSGDGGIKMILGAARGG